MSKRDPQLDLDFDPRAKLAELLNEPSKAATLSKEALARLRGELVQLDTLLLSYALKDNIQQNGNVHGDQLLDVNEACVRLGVSRQYLYQNQANLPFTRHVGRRLLFSARDMERYIADKRS